MGQDQDLSDCLLRLLRCLPVASPGLAGRAVLALSRHDFKAEGRSRRAAADACNAQRAVNDLDPQHPQRAGRPIRDKSAANRSVACQRRRWAGEFQRAIGMDHRPPVGHFHVGNRLLHEAIEARGRAAGIEKIVAASRGRRAAGLVVRAVTRHGFHQKSRGQCSVAILILLRTATPFSATRQPQPRQICRSGLYHLHGLQC